MRAQISAAPPNLGITARFLQVSWGSQRYFTRTFLRRKVGTPRSSAFFDGEFAFLETTARHGSNCITSCRAWTYFSFLAGGGFAGSGTLGSVGSEKGSGARDADELGAHRSERSVLEDCAYKPPWRRVRGGFVAFDLDRLKQSIRKATELPERWAAWARARVRKRRLHPTRVWTRPL